MTTMTANTIQTTTSSQRWTVVAPAAPAVTQPARRERRARDFGVGYGNSSGYASSKRYADNWGNARFHCG
jgi:hypothetical protein